jgi:hypothetical protein
MNAIISCYLDVDEYLDEYLSFESYSSDNQSDSSIVSEKTIEESDVDNKCCCIIN